MNTPPLCVFLDTNVYIVGAAVPGSPESQILVWAGWDQVEPRLVEIVFSVELLNQIARVARRVRNKDWAGEIINKIGKEMNLAYAMIDDDEVQEIENKNILPREDISVYLTARNGHAECFVSSNHELIRALAYETKEFECLTPEQFVEKYLR